MSRVSPRADGSIPAASNRSCAFAGDPAHPARAARKVLRRCANAASTTANTRDRVDASVGHGASGYRSMDESRLHLRHRPEHRPPDRPRAAHGAEEPGLDARDAVGPRPWWGGQPVRDLRLHHNQRGAQARQFGEQVQQNGHRDVVGEVRDEGGGRLPQMRRRHPQRVGLDDGQPVREIRGAFQCGRRQSGGQHRIDLHRDQRAGDVEQRQRQRTESGPDLEHPVG